jgi:phosphoglycerol transferase MdoB-like AlkP superfamily enzyme
MSTILTLSSHEPFEVPIPNKFIGDDLPSKFRKAANYTDLSFGEFMAKAEKEKWFKNTLFVVVADHGHRLPKEYDNAYDHRKFRIPLFFYGEVINKKYNGTVVNKIGSQTDIASTLLNQINISDTAFHWSTNLLDKSKEGFAFYSYDNGIGWVDEQNTINVDNVRKELIYQKTESLKIQQKKKIAQAYMQCVFKTYLNY